MVKYRKAEIKKGRRTRYSHRNRIGSPPIKRTAMKPESFPVFEYHKELNAKEKSEMNANIERAIADIDKVDALMYAIENACLDLEVMPESKKRYDRGVGAFYALWDAVHKVADDLDKLSQDELVVDAIYAVNDVKRTR